MKLLRKEKNISSKLFEKFFGCSIPSDMYKALNYTTGLEESKAQVNTIENRLANLMEVVKISPTSDAKKIIITEITCRELLNLFFALIN